MKSPSRKWKPTPESLVQTFRQVMARWPQAEQRKMFGFPAAFVKGRMFACLFEDSFVLRLSEEDRSAILKLGGEPFEPMPGRIMREYALVPQQIVGSLDQLESWISKALAHTGALPPKPPRTKRQKPSMP